MDKIELERIKKMLSDLSPKGSMITAQYCAVDPEILLEPPTVQNAHTADLPFIHQHAHSGFQSFTYENPRFLDKEKLDRFLDGLPPNIFRCKGWVKFRKGTALINLTGGGFRYEVSEEDHETMLVFVGRNLDEKRITDGLEKCFL